MHCLIVGPDVHLDVVHDVLAKFSEMNLWMFYLNSLMLEPLDAEFDVLLELADDVVLLLEPLDVEVVEAHLVQLLDGDFVVDLCAEFLDHDVGSELLMSNSLQFVYEYVVDAPLQVVPAILMFKLCICELLSKMITFT